MTANAFTIAAVHHRLLDVAMKKPFGIAGGAQDVARNVLVDVELESGVHGFGEAAPLPAFNGETQADAIAAIERAAAALVGFDVRAWRPLAERAAAAAGVGDTRAAPRAASAACAVETAALDALTRSLDTSLDVFFGGAEDDLVTDVTITTGSVDDAAREARAFAEFATLKIKVGGCADHDVDADVARVVAVHEARPDARLLLDANGGLSVDAAVHLADALRARGIVPALFEQPVAGPLEALAEVRGRTKLRVALDESITAPADVAAAFRAGAADAVNVKLMKSGIARALDIVGAARACGLDPMIGGMVESRLAMCASACFAAGLGRFAFVDLDTPLFLAADPFDGGCTFDGERIDLRPIVLGHGCVPR